MSHESVTVLRLKHRPPGVCFSQGQTRFGGTNLAKKAETSKKLYIKV